MAHSKLKSISTEFYGTDKLYCNEIKKMDEMETFIREDTIKKIKSSISKVQRFICPQKIVWLQKMI